MDREEFATRINSYSRRPRLQAYIAKQIQINDLTRRCQCSKIPHAHLRSPPAQDKRGVDLISNLLPFGRLWYGEPDAISNAVGYTKFYSRSHDAVIRVYDEPGNVIEPHEHA